MFEKFRNRKKLLNQKKCLESLKFVLEPNNLENYKTAEGLIEYHRNFKNGELLTSPTPDPLFNIRKFYKEDLDESTTMVKGVPADKKDEFLKRISADQNILEELTLEFIEQYNQFLYNLNVIKENQEYLDEEQKETLLSQYNELFNKENNIKK